jgi:hypothetical protein
VEVKRELLYRVQARDGGQTNVEWRPSAAAYGPDNHLPCGARLWVETTAPVISELDGLTRTID